MILWCGSTGTRCDPGCLRTTFAQTRGRRTARKILECSHHCLRGGRKRVQSSRVPFPWSPRFFSPSAAYPHRPSAPPQTVLPNPSSGCVILTTRKQLLFVCSPAPSPGLCLVRFSQYNKSSALALIWIGICGSSRGFYSIPIGSNSNNQFSRLRGYRGLAPASPWAPAPAPTHHARVPAACWSFHDPYGTADSVATARSAALRGTLQPPSTTILDDYIAFHPSV